MKLIRYIFCIYKERLQKEAREKYQNLSEEEKDKRQKKARERHQNVTKEENKKGHQYYLECKKRLSDYRRIYLLN